jgi:nitrate/nitrite-specific signal transduction histidine kinase
MHKFIEVITKVDNGTRSIIIKDNGIGFDSNFQKEKLFKPLNVSIMREQEAE